MQSNSQTIQILNRQIEELDQKNNSLHKDLLVKDDEKHHLMLQYRKLINERESDEKNLRRALEEANHSRYLIITSLDLIMIEKKLGTTESELEALRHDCNNLKTDLAYQERQNSECRGSLGMTERKLSDCELDKQRLHRELLSARELLHQVDREREGLKSQLLRISPGEDANDRPQSWIIERETLLLELSEVRSKVVQLENTLSEMRNEASSKKLLGETETETERLNSLEATLRLQAAGIHDSIRSSRQEGINLKVRRNDFSFEAGESGEAKCNF